MKNIIRLKKCHSLNFFACCVVQLFTEGFSRLHPFPISQLLEFTRVPDSTNMNRFARFFYIKIFYMKILIIDGDSMASSPSADDVLESRAMTTEVTSRLSRCGLSRVLLYNIRTLFLFSFSSVSFSFLLRIPRFRSHRRPAP